MEGASRINRKAVRELMNKDDVKLEAWAPLGQGNADLFKEPILVALTEKYGKNVGQLSCALKCKKELSFFLN